MGQFFLRPAARVASCAHVLAELDRGVLHSGGIVGRLSQRVHDQTGKLLALMRRLGLVLLLSAGLVGCEVESGENGSKPSAEEQRQNESRAKSLMRRYEQLATDDPQYGDYRVQSVGVDGGEVTVKTSLYPDDEGRPFFTGACTQLIGWEPWIERIVVEGQDEVGHAQWSKGEPVCSITGL